MRFDKANREIFREVIATEGKEALLIDVAAKLIKRIMNK